MAMRCEKAVSMLAVKSSPTVGRPAEASEAPDRDWNPCRTRQRLRTRTLCVETTWTFCDGGPVCCSGYSLPRADAVIKTLVKVECMSTPRLRWARE